MANIRIDKEFSTLLPKLSAEEYGILEESIRKEGCREPICVWNGAIVDGHLRYEICTKYDISYEIREMQFDSRDQAMLWIIRNQLSRRNLSLVDKVLIAQKGTAFLKEKARKKQSDGGKYKGGMKEAEPVEASDNIGKSSDDQSISVRREISEITGLSEGTVGKIQKIEKECPDLLEAIRCGEISINKAYKTISGSSVSRSSEPELLTPSAIIESARKVMGSIDTDPASNDEAQEQIRAETYYTAEDDGLTREWFGNIWLNPPRSTELVSRFTEQLISELSAGHIRSAIVLVDNATDTAWFQMLTARSSAVCFHEGPVRFAEAGNKRSVTPKHGQVIVYYGPDTEKFYDVFSIMGNVFKLM